VQEKSASATIELLSPLWQSVLRCSAAEVEDNFFEQGGDPWLAIELFRLIGAATGRHLPPMLIYQAPTPGSLASLLDSSAPPQLASVVLLKAGTLRPPVFLLHGMGGNLLELFELVRSLQTEHPVYGMQERGSDGIEPPCDSVEEFAEFHLQTMQQIQPSGPYILIGYSFGGLVAYEMARRLAGSKSEVALLILIDSYPHRRHVCWQQRTGIRIREARERGARTVAALLGRQPPAGRPALGGSYTPAMGRVRECANRALERYRPGYYGGRIKFVRAGVSVHFPNNPGKVWAKLAEGFEVETVPGDHHEILGIYADRLASVVSRYLAEVPNANAQKGPNA
jgi:acetoacetyl-CoA synthetase